MTLNYDPDGKPELTPEMSFVAAQLKMQVVCVICDEAEARVGDDTGVSFFAMTAFLPRAGDHIKLENGAHCVVKKSFFAVSRFDGEIGLVPTVYASKVDR